MNSHKVPCLKILALVPFPDVQSGDDLGKIIAAVLKRSSLHLEPHDVLVVAQKIISKAEGRRVRLDTIVPSSRAVDLAATSAKDPRLVELILRESNHVVREGHGAIIVEHRNGYVLANAGIDQSNVCQGDVDDEALLLPIDPDRSAALLRAEIFDRTGVKPAIVINDSWGRAWRRGVIGTAIGIAGIDAVADLRGRLDLNGRPLKATEVAVADELAAAASLLMGQANEGRPVVLVRGLALPDSSADSRGLLRPRDEDLFR